MAVMITAERPDHPDAVAMIDELQAHLGSVYPVESQHGFSVQKLIEQQVAFFVLRVDGRPAGCGGVMLVGSEYAELKRMYVRPEFRGAGHGERIIAQLAAHARAHGVQVLRLETGVRQTAAIRLYERAGFTRIAPFGPYRPDPWSVCFEKKLPESESFKN
ncbi:MAG TPA: GNAT family N-acetyltransferase [Lacunisphaera sp.]|nr:GNAT family N-acetyltransferase [Lacunisphaera sp.]